MQSWSLCTNTYSTTHTAEGPKMQSVLNYILTLCNVFLYILYLTPLRHFLTHILLRHLLPNHAIFYTLLHCWTIIFSNIKLNIKVLNWIVTRAMNNVSRYFEYMNEPNFVEIKLEAEYLLAFFFALQCPSLCTCCCSSPWKALNCFLLALLRRCLSLSSAVIFHPLPCLLRHHRGLDPRLGLGR